MSSCESSITEIQTVRFDLSPVSEPIAAYLSPGFQVCPRNRLKKRLCIVCNEALPSSLNTWIGRLRPSSADCQTSFFHDPASRQRRQIKWLDRYQRWSCPTDNCFHDTFISLSGLGLRKEDCIFSFAKNVGSFF